ncbi:MAG: 50S ribosomal protein L3 [Proteobacteria bacterium]|nr:50S ribosomal protein L3 [Pseudomonadota bacterium]
MTRTGMIGIKLGMTRIFDESGNQIPVTLIALKDNKIIAQKRVDKDGYDAVVMGYGIAAAHRVSKPVRGICAKAKVEPVKGMKEFRVSADCFIDIGSQISADHFVIGQYVDISAQSIGKGFAGAMKRHNFSGLEASHGVSISHRSHGSTGQRQDPGKVFKNKKMAGHMGDVRVTAQNLQVVDVDVEMGVIAIKGAVPGSEQAVVYLSDAIKKALPPTAPVPAAIVKGIENKVVEARVQDSANEGMIEHNESIEEDVAAKLATEVKEGEANASQAAADGEQQ